MFKTVNFINKFGKHYAQLNIEQKEAVNLMK